MFRAPSRRSTMDEESEAGLEMAPTRRLEDISELPDSVARSRLFSLPREIRDRIYFFCLAAREGESVEWPNKSQPADLGMTTQLLVTCKLIYAEATNVLYNSNTLSFEHPSDANIFVRAISSPIGTVAYLNLQVKAQDTRLWMPYLTSTDPARSLKADFSNLKELVIHYKSNKWQHGLPVEANLRHWSEDSRLEEMIKGLGHIFYPAESTELPASTPATQEEFQRYLEDNLDTFPSEEGTFKQRLLQLHRAQQAFASARQPPSPPKISIICVCRVHPNQFIDLTSNSPPPPQQQPHAQPAHGAQGVAGPAAAAVGMIPGMATLQGMFTPAPLQTQITPQPVQQGEEFRGFSPLDFKGRAMRLFNSSPKGRGAVTLVARTVLVRKGKIGLALEVSSSEPPAR